MNAGSADDLKAMTATDFQLQQSLVHFVHIIKYNDTNGGCTHMAQICCWSVLLTYAQLIRSYLTSICLTSCVTSHTCTRLSHFSMQHWSALGMRLYMHVYIAQTALHL